MVGIHVKEKLFLRTERTDPGGVECKWTTFHIGLLKKNRCHVFELEEISEKWTRVLCHNMNHKTHNFKSFTVNDFSTYL